MGEGGQCWPQAVRAWQPAPPQPPYLVGHCFPAQPILGVGTGCAGSKVFSPQIGGRGFRGWCPKVTPPSKFDISYSTVVNFCSFAYLRETFKTDGAMLSITSLLPY